MRALRIAVGLVLSLPAFAQPGPATKAPSAAVLVVGVGPDEMLVDAGTTVSLGVRLVSGAATRRRVRVDADVPADWRVIVGGGAVDLGAGRSALHLLGVRVPKTAAAGEYAVPITVYGEAGGVVGRIHRRVQVREQRAVAVDVIDAPRIAIEGHPARLVFRVANEGNAPAPLALHATSSARSDLLMTPTELRLGPGESATVVVEVVPGSSDRASDDRVRLVATHDESTTASAVATMALVAEVGGGGPRRSWPILATAALSVDGDHAHPRGGLQGDVALDANRRHRLTFDMVGPTAGAFGQRANGYVRYKGPGVRTTAGHGISDLSPGTATRMFGPGLELALNRGRADVGLAVRRGAGYRLRSREIGGAVGFRPSPGLRLSLNGFATASALSDGTVGAVSARVESSRPGFRVDAEGGVPLGGPPRPVYALNLVSTRKGASAWALARSVVSQYGLGERRRTASAGVTAPLRRGFSVEALGTTSARETAGGDRSVYGIGQSVREVRVGVRRAQGTVQFAAGARTEGVSSGGDHRVAHGGYAEGALAFGSTRLSVGAHAARVEAPDGWEGGPAWSVLAGARRRSEAGEIFVRAEAVGGASIRSPVVQDRTRLALGGRLDLGPVQIGGDVGAGRVHTKGPSVQSVSGSATVTWRTPTGHEIAAAAQGFSAAGYSDTRLQLSVRVPLEVPAPFGPAPRLVKGRVVDVTTGRGVPDVLIQVGNGAALTCAEGGFVVRAPDGPTFLTLDRSTLQADLVPTETFPRTTVPGETVTVRVAPRAAIRGRIETFDVLGAGSQADTVAVGSVGGAVVEGCLVDAVDTCRRAVTDREGRFVVDDLPAGAYALRLVRSPLTEPYRLESTTLVVQAIGDVEVLWRAIETKRPLRLLAASSHRVQGRTRTVPPATEPLRPWYCSTGMLRPARDGQTAPVLPPGEIDLKLRSASRQSPGGVRTSLEAVRAAIRALESAVSRCSSRPVRD